MIKEINKKLITQTAFIGPLWFRWFMMLPGFFFWFIEPLSQSIFDFKLAWHFLSFGEVWFDNKQHLLFFFFACFMSFCVLSFFVFFPSFWIMLTGIIFKGILSTKSVLFLTFPLLGGIFFYDLFRRMIDWIR